MRDTDGQVKTLLDKFINDYGYLVFCLDAIEHVKTVCWCISGAPLLQNVKYSDLKGGNVMLLANSPFLVNYFRIRSWRSHAVTEQASNT